MREKNKILVSVIIPCRNEAGYIRQTIEHIVSSDFELSDLEVLAIDGMSTDSTREILNEFSHKFPNFKVIDNFNQTTPYAFNIGIKNSTGDFVLIVGARHSISKNYIEGCIKTLEDDPKIAGVGGKVINVYEDEIAKGVSIAMNSPLGVGIGNFRILNKSGSVDTVGTPMYRREIFDKVGLFDEELARNQDDEFNYRVKQAGYFIWLNNNINISYFVRPSFSKLFKQYFQYGYWKVFVNKKLKTVTTLRQLIPFLFILFLILYPAVLIINETAFLLYPVLVFLYLSLLSIVSVYSATGINKVAGVVFVSFICLHFGYGLGYLNGFIDFILLRRSPGKKMSSLTR